jgi:hypothetical protein
MSFADLCRLQDQITASAVGYFELGKQDGNAAATETAMKLCRLGKAVRALSFLHFPMASKEWHRADE